MAATTMARQCEQLVLTSLTARGVPVTSPRLLRTRCPDLEAQTPAGAVHYDVTTRDPRTRRARPHVGLRASGLIAWVDGADRIQFFDVTGDPHPDCRDAVSQHVLSATADALVAVLARQAARACFAAWLTQERRR
jgi:hypothetical protein